MKKKKKSLFILLILLLLAIIIILIILFGNPKKDKGSSETAQTTTTQVATTSAETAETSETARAEATTTKAATEAETTEPPSIFQGSITGTWKGQIDDDPPVDISGTFSVKIDEHGDISGTFDGDFSGTVAGHVDLLGNMACTGTASGDATAGVTSWQGAMSVYGTSLSAQGDLSGEYMTGEFSGTGTASH